MVEHAFMRIEAASDLAFAGILNRDTGKANAVVVLEHGCGMVTDLRLANFVRLAVDYSSRDYRGVATMSRQRAHKVRVSHLLIDRRQTSEEWSDRQASSGNQSATCERSAECHKGG